MLPLIFWILEKKKQQEVKSKWFLYWCFILSLFLINFCILFTFILFDVLQLPGYE